MHPTVPSNAAEAPCIHATREAEKVQCSNGYTPWDEAWEEQREAERLGITAAQLQELRARERRARRRAALYFCV